MNTLVYIDALRELLWKICKELNNLIHRNRITPTKNTTLYWHSMVQSTLPSYQSEITTIWVLSHPPFPPETKRSHQQFLDRILLFSNQIFCFGGHTQKIFLADIWHTIKFLNKCLINVFPLWTVNQLQHLKSKIRYCSFLPLWRYSSIIFYSYFSK